MPKSKVGIVYYANDPNNRVFRVIYPEFDDSELDQPPTDGNRRPYLKPDGTPHSWTSLGTNATRVAILDKVLPTDLRFIPIVPVLNVDGTLATVQPLINSVGVVPFDLTGTP